MKVAVEWKVRERPPSAVRLVKVIDQRDGRLGAPSFADGRVLLADGQTLCAYARTAAAFPALTNSTAAAAVIEGIHVCLR
jgi:hypothetical protein